MLDAKKIESLLKNYRLIVFNKQNYGKYINNMLLDELNFDVTEEEIADFFNSFNRLPTYPRDGIHCFELLNSIYVMANPVAEVAKQKNVDRSLVYRHRDKAIKLLTKLYKEEIDAKKVFV